MRVENPSVTDPKFAEAMAWMLVQIGRQITKRRVEERQTAAQRFDDGYQRFLAGRRTAPVQG